MNCVFFICNSNIIEYHLTREYYHFCIVSVSGKMKEATMVSTQNLSHGIFRFNLSITVEIVIAKCDTSCNVYREETPLGYFLR